MSRLFASPLAFLVGGIFLLALLLFLLSIWQLRQARRNPYWRQRRAAGWRSIQFLLLSIALAISGVIASARSEFGIQALTEISRLFVYASETPIPTMSLTPTVTTPTLDLRATVNVEVQASLEALLTATAALIETRIASTPPTATATETQTPSVTPTPTSTATPTLTPTVTSTPTPTPTLPGSINLTPPPSALQPPPGALVEIVAASDSAEGLPLTHFEPGTRRIFSFITFEGMRNGITWSRVLIRDGVPIQGGTYPWALGEAGDSFFFFGREGGYPPGNYEVRLFLGEAEVNRLTFTVGIASEIG